MSLVSVFFFYNFCWSYCMYQQQQLSQDKETKSCGVGSCSCRMGSDHITETKYCPPGCLKSCLALTSSLLFSFSHSFIHSMLSFYILYNSFVLFCNLMVGESFFKGVFFFSLLVYLIMLKKGLNINLIYLKFIKY